MAKKKEPAKRHINREFTILHCLRLQAYSKLFLTAENEQQFRDCLKLLWTSTQALMSIPDEAITNTFEAMALARAANAVAGTPKGSRTKKRA